MVFIRVIAFDGLDVGLEQYRPGESGESFLDEF
jgi:hypothetical protein